MKSFFSRILISVWLVSVGTLLLTFLVAQLLPSGEQSGKKIYEYVAEHLAEDLRQELKINPRLSNSFVTNNLTVPNDSLIQVSIISPQGKLLLGSLEQSRKPRFQLGARFSHHRIEIIEGLQGYKIVAQQKRYPLNEILIKPGARLILLFSAIFISIAISYMLSSYIVDPVRRLRLAGQKVANGDLSVRVSHTVKNREDDIAKLAHDFDVMTEKVEELLNSQQRLMRDVSHELRSPLARLQALLSISKQNMELGEDALDEDTLAKMESEAERLNNLIEEILKFARLNSNKAINRHTTDIVDLLNVIAEDAAIEGLEHNKDVLISGIEQCILQVDSAMIHSAFENVIRNALRYTPNNTNVLVSININSQNVIVKIRDHGSGVPEEDLDTLFEPFFRVEEGRVHGMGGGGIGLAIAFRSMKLHNGSVKAMNHNSGGLVVEFKLPLNN